MKGSLMYITFLIGNGFDLNLGLKTRYSDFYDYYKESATKDSVILQWIQEDNDKGDWADLECALGERVKGIDEESLEKYIDSLWELDLLLLNYLEEEKNKYDIGKDEKGVLAEIARSLKDIPKELTPEEQLSYDSTCKNARNEDLQYRFISFNYTDVLDLMIEKASAVSLDLGSHTDMNGRFKKHTIGDVHHVHGTLTEGVVLGVNDVSQINNESLSKDDMFLNIFLKDRINHQMGQRRTELAEEIINKSQIICIFGMSLGITDKRWWEKIITWLLANENRKVIIYARADERKIDRKIPTFIIPEKEKLRRDFWEKGKGKQSEDGFEKIKSRIFVIFNSRIFSFPKVEES